MSTSSTWSIGVAKYGSVSAGVPSTDEERFLGRRRRAPTRRWWSSSCARWAR